MHEINLPSGQPNKVAISEEIDSQNAHRLRAVLQVKLSEKHPVLVIDCTNLEFIDSRGTAALLEYVRDAGEFSGRLRVFGLNAKLHAVFTTMHLDEHFEISDHA